MDKYKIFTGLFVGSLILTPIQAHATDSISNPLSGSQGESSRQLQDRFEKEDNTNKAKESQPFDIQSEAYTIYSDAKSSFNKLQMQYGSLDESANMSDGFKGYLKTIQENKENQQFQAKVSQMAQGNYKVNTTEETMQSLSDAVNGVSDEDKKKLMDAQDDENKTEEYNSDSAFAEGFGSDTKTMTDNYNQSKTTNDRELEESSKNQIKEFGNSKNESKVKAQEEKNATDKNINESKQNIDDKSNQLTKEYEKASNDNSLKANGDKEATQSFAQGASGQNKTIQKNYSVLRKQILNVQKLLSQSSKFASTSKTYANKIKVIINKATK